MIITIDGLGVNGKTTLSKMIANKYKFKNFSAGAIYRCIALKILNESIDMSNLKELIHKLSNIDIEFREENQEQKVFLDNQEVTDRIREEDISFYSTKWATIREIKYLVRQIQKEFGNKYNVVMEGRDIGTIIFPNADIKFYLHSDFETRVKRLYEQRKNYEKVTYEEISNDLKQRDDLDINGGNFVKPEGAIEIKTDNLNINEIFTIMVNDIDKVLSK